MRSQFLKDLLLHPYWLVFSLSGIYFFFFALNRGGVNVFIWAGAFFVLTHLMWGDFSLKDLSPRCWVVVAVCALLILMSLIFSYEGTHEDRVFTLVKMLAIIFCMLLTGRTTASTTVFGVFGSLLALSVIWQFTAYIIFGMPYGTWSNPHYLANFAVLSLPLVFYYFRTVPIPYNILFLLLAVVDIDPVFRNGSRPAFLALMVSSLFVITFFVRSRYRWIGLLAVIGSLIFLSTTNYDGFFEKLNHLIVNLSNEERVTIWKYSWTMLQDNSPLAWFVGNGIGSTKDILQKYSTAYPLYKNINFPHNFFIQILFENGLIGSVLVFGGLAHLLYLFIKLAHTAVVPSVRLFVNCMMAAFLNCLIFTGLTVGFYSKYTLYPLAFIIGTLFVMLEKSRNGP
jgi:O-antigen ligase